MKVKTGDHVYYPDIYGGFVPRLCQEPVEFVCFKDGELYLLCDGDSDPMKVGEYYFLTEEDAWEWCLKHRPAPPYRFGYEQPKWMDSKVWIPSGSGDVYVKVGNAVKKAFYDGECFLDEEDGLALDGITAWMPTLFGHATAIDTDDFTWTPEDYTLGCELPF